MTTFSGIFRSICTISLLFISTVIAAQCTSWATGSDETSPGSVKIWSSTSTDNNDYYISGSMEADFSAGAINFQLLETAQGYFTAKYNTSGNIVWGKVFETINLPVIYGPRIVANNDYIYAILASNGTLKVEGNDYGNASSYNFCMIKMDTAGAIQWVKVMKDSAASSLVYPGDISLDNVGNIITTGRFNGYLNFGPTTLTSSSNTTFIAKFNSDGNLIWAEKTLSPGSSTSRGWVIAGDSENNILVGGYVSNQLNMGPCSGVISYPLTINPYLAKLDGDGNCIWLKVADGNQTFSSVEAVATDASDNVYWCGAFNDTITWGASSLYSNTGSFYFMKSDKDGNILWAKNFGNSNDTLSQLPTSLNFDKNGNIWMTGWVGENTTFGSIDINTGGQGVFAVQFDTAGNILDGWNGKGLYTSYTSLIDTSGALIIAGEALGDTIGFDADEYYLTDNSSEGYFILRNCFADTTGDTTSIVNTVLDDDFLIYPNPANGSFVITLEAFANADAAIVVKNMNGANIYSNKIELKPGKNMFPVTIKDFSNSIYMIEIHSANKIVRKQLVLTK